MIENEISAFKLFENNQYETRNDFKLSFSII